MGRWTQYEEAEHRLPEGFTRTGYDADTGRYTYEDREGRQYRSEPYTEYGKLTPVPDFYEARRQMLAAAKAKHTGPPPTSFADILSSTQIATSPTASPESTSPKSPRSKFISVARKATLPKMKGVVDNLLTPRSKIAAEDKAGAHRIPSPPSSPTKPSMRSFFQSRDSSRREDASTIGRSATTAAAASRHRHDKSYDLPRKDDIRRSRTVAESRTSSPVERSHRPTFEEDHAAISRSHTSTRSRPASPHSSSSRPSSRNETTHKSILTHKPLPSTEKPSLPRPRFEEPRDHRTGIMVPAGASSGMRRPKDDLRRERQPVIAV
ncbi:carbohydrate-binding module family 50 protein [Moniliophthora roreri]|uniref:Carbohydrate-binding module family 50 protein n=1 Tax=Moniliophthora roreri TaxID=221103 RepID=A0A0W0G0X4_MONRR|nr:carbohydrate-binding module family 50 protein [Moniliophthora roreri]